LIVEISRNLRRAVCPSEEITMPFKALLASTSLVCALGLVPGLPAQAQTAAALSGQVSSAEEGLMEGVLVSRREGPIQLPGG
jgi:hypothetical protein